MSNDRWKINRIADAHFTRRYNARIDTKILLCIFHDRTQDARVLRQVLLRLDRHPTPHGRNLAPYFNTSKPNLPPSPFAFNQAFNLWFSFDKKVWPKASHVPGRRRVYVAHDFKRRSSERMNRKRTEVGAGWRGELEYLGRQR